MVRNDNRLNNLHLYENRKEHLTKHATLNKLVRELLEKKIIIFEEGEYKMNKEEDKMVVVGVPK